MTGFPDAVFLDRDGTIIEDVHYIRSPDQVRLLPGSARAIRRLNQAAVKVIVATNQSGIARGLVTLDDYNAVRSRLDELLAREGARIDASYFCPHHPDADGPCPCRKPGTGMFEDAIRDFHLRGDAGAYIGDRWRDVVPSRKLGGRGIMIASPLTTADDLTRAANDGIETAPSLEVAVDRILGLTDTPRAK
jgi:D-glycero-D-manno-heptose 1,7-bisphosphate phosphatase